MAHLTVEKIAGYDKASLLSEPIITLTSRQHNTDSLMLMKNKALSLIIEKDLLVTAVVIFNADDRS